MAQLYTHPLAPDPLETMDGKLSIPIEDLMGEGDDIGALLDTYFEVLRAQLIRDWEANRSLLVAVLDTPASEEGQ